VNEVQSWLVAVVDVDVVDDVEVNVVDDIEDVDEVIEVDELGEVDVVDEVDDVDAALPTMASAIPAPALPLFTQAIDTEDNFDETTSYSVPITWGFATLEMRLNPLVVVTFPIPPLVP
jgi:hypothetical protein